MDEQDSVQARKQLRTDLDSVRAVYGELIKATHDYMLAETRRAELHRLYEIGYQEELAAGNVGGKNEDERHGNYFTLHRKEWGALEEATVLAATRKVVMVKRQLMRDQLQAEMETFKIHGANYVPEYTE